MAIKRSPLKSDSPGKCSRWRVILYNPATHKQEWHTVGGTRRDAEAFERREKTKLVSGLYIAKRDRRTFAQVAEMFLKERTARDRRTSTVLGYQSVLSRHILPEFGPREIGTIRRADIADYLDAKRDAGTTVQTLNRIVRTMKAVLFFALERELVDRVVMQRFRPFEGGKGERHAQRDAFSESELQAIIAVARPDERVLIGLLCFTGLRPGEAYALDWSAVDLEQGCLCVTRSWDHRGGKFVEPKTKAGLRVVPLSRWLVAELAKLRDRSGGQGLVFPNRKGTPLDPANVRRSIWKPLKRRAGVRELDLYSLRHSFASLGRTAGESAFNVARMMGHSRSTLVDAVYAHTLQSGLASVAEAVTCRALGLKPDLRVIEGGKSPDVRKPLEKTPSDVKDNAATN